MNPVPEQVYTQARYRKTIYLNLNSKVCGCPLYSTQGDLCSNVSVSAEVTFSPVELRVASKTNPNVKVFGQPLPSPWSYQHCCAAGHCPRRLAKGHLTGKTDVKKDFSNTIAQPYILRVEVLELRTPQTICNFPQKDCLRTRKLSFSVPESQQFCNVLQIKVKKC